MNRLRMLGPSGGRHMVMLLCPAGVLGTLSPRPRTGVGPTAHADAWSPNFAHVAHYPWFVLGWQLSLAGFEMPLWDKRRVSFVSPPSCCWFNWVLTRWHVAGCQGSTGLPLVEIVCVWLKAKTDDVWSLSPNISRGGLLEQVLCFLELARR